MTFFAVLDCLLLLLTIIAIFRIRKETIKINRRLGEVVRVLAESLESGKFTFERTNGAADIILTKKDLIQPGTERSPRKERR